MLLLDGINRLPGETLAILQRLLLDRELELFDGTRLITAEHYNELESQGVVPPASDAVRRFLKSHRPVRCLCSSVHGDGVALWFTSCAFAV